MNNKVKAYVALAASFAALEVNSQVVCVTPNVGPFTATGADDPKVSVELDIDGDGTNDFQIMVGGYSSPGQYFSAGATFSFARANIGIAGVNGAGILAYSSFSNAAPIVLSYSQTINSLAGNFYSQTVVQSYYVNYVGFKLASSFGTQVNYATGSSYSFGTNSQLNGGAPAYIGINFDAGNNSAVNDNYGWIEVQATALGPFGTGASATPAVQVEILSYGYE